MSGRLKISDWPFGWRTVIFGAVGLILIWLVIHAFLGAGIGPGLLPEHPAEVPHHELAVVPSESVPIQREVIGTVQSRLPVVASSRVSARVIAVRVHTGERVTRNQVMVVLDGSDLRARLAQAQAELAAAQAQLTRTSADHKRYSALFKRGSVTAHEYDAAEAAWRSASANVAQSRAAVAAARAGLEYATVRAAVDGVVVSRMVEPGDMAMPGKPLIRLYAELALRVQLEVPENLAQKIAIGTPLDVFVDATGSDYHTSVDEIVPAADPASRSFLIRAAMPSGKGLRPGMFAHTSIAVGTTTVLTIPRDAVERVGQLDTVRVYSHGRIERRMVSLGRVLGNRIEVLAGLHAGERVVLGSTGANAR